MVGRVDDGGGITGIGPRQDADGDDPDMRTSNAMNVPVTGANGYIGQAVCARLQAAATG